MQSKDFQGGTTANSKAPKHATNSSMSPFSTKEQHPSRPSSSRRSSALNIFKRHNTELGQTPNHSSNSLNGQFDVDNFQLASPPLSRLTQRTAKNLRMWYLGNNSAYNKRRTELERLRELKRSKLLFAQAFLVSPMTVVTATSLRPEDNDEHKVPALLQQLGIVVSSGQAHHYKNLLRIQLEYGSGRGLVKWEILRGYRDLAILRVKLRSRSKLRKTPKLPKLPHPKAFGLGKKFTLKDGGVVKGSSNSDSDSDSDSDEFDEEEAHEGEHNDDDPDGHLGDAELDVVANTYARMREDTASLNSQQKKENESRVQYAAAVEVWLNKIKDMFMLRSDSNELMQFLEMSHLSLKLAPEYQFHGKEGTMVIRSRASDMGWRVNHLRLTDFQDMVKRHTKKWVLIRDSFIVVVDNIYSTLIREVFMVDPYFDVKHLIMTEDVPQDNASNLDGVEGYELDALPGQDGKEMAYPDVPAQVHKRPGAKSVFLHLKNNEREIKLAVGSDRDLRRWQASLLQMKNSTPWSGQNRFNSFAPVRKNVFGQWFVDGRDYMWVLSDALENARDTIYILDWWLSPELYLRRPPEGNQKWRLDRVLKRKAEQGVKIFVIVYRNVNAAIPIDSLWTKHSLLGLHENIHVMRSPNQLKKKGALFWAHHEKLCVIDSTIAFNGGIDLCFGRWDTWEHTLIDDAPTPFLPSNPTQEEWDKKKTQLFPGKEYNNARVKDFYFLNKPWDETHDRNNVPRMPWHDVHQMVLGQPARDLCRHFIQRWNYVIRQKLPSRPTPFLLPPPDFTQEELERLQLTGTCEYQVLRSSGQWSLGLNKHEQSIQNAYLQLIEESEHLVYIENQFFITSTEVEGVKIENNIGNALVQRIVRAHANHETWKAFIVIPLMPGFEAEIDSDKASSVRIICRCQYSSISRGPNSIFYRLEQLGIRPDQYINFMSLRKWGKFSDTKDSPNEGRLTTELLYIHAKTMVVDDRVAIIGSANINERSMRGMRDSEVAVCVRDAHVIESKMAGKPYKVGKFAHTLRMRLMREHLGVDIDKFDIVERFMKALDNTAKKFSGQGSRNPKTAPPPQTPVSAAAAHEHGSFERVELMPQPDPATNAAVKDVTGNAPVVDDEFPDWLYPDLHSFNWYAGTNVNKGIRDHKKFSFDSRLQRNAEHKADLDGDGYDHWKARLDQEDGILKRRMLAAEHDVKMENEARNIFHELLKDRKITNKDQLKRVFYSRLTKQDILRPLKRASELPRPRVDEDGLRAVNCENIPIDPWAFSDPVEDRFVNDMLLAVAERNTLIFRMVFRCQPDDEAETWKDYKTFAAHFERFFQKQKEDGGPNKLRKTGVHKPERVNKLVLSGEIKQQDPSLISRQIKSAANHTRSTVSTAAASLMSSDNRPKISSIADEEDFDREEYKGLTNEEREVREMERLGINSPMRSVPPSMPPSTPSSPKEQSREDEQSSADDFVSGFKPARQWGHFDHVLDAQVAEDMLQGVTGHLVVFPTEWLSRELDSGNWSFQMDRISPLDIYD